MTPWIPLLAGGLLAAAELLFSGRRIVWSAVTGLGGVIVAATVLAVATANVGRSVAMTVAGAAAAVAALAIVRVLAERDSARR